MKVIMIATTFSDGRIHLAGKVYDVENIRASGWLARGVAHEAPPSPAKRTPEPLSQKHAHVPELAADAATRDTDPDHWKEQDGDAN